jgi:nucleoside-diphosphate-sugar epimerase
MIPEQYRLKNTIKYPTSLIVGGLSKLGLEIADSLIEQGGYVILVDTYTDDNVSKLEALPKDALISFLDYTTIPNLDEEIRRLDYVFYFAHDQGDGITNLSTQEFLNFSNYLDSTLSLASRFDAKFLLTTSIKAHQKVVQNEDLQMNYAADSSSKHKIYTNLELQRYAESLTIEYFEKINLDSRIVRVAELIGDGIDFNKDSAFVALVLAAAMNQTLKLQKDGLETEYLAHVLDAAYGIIKAQFSQNTKGKIFSLSYDHPFTHLSIAYKIQEVDEGSQHIQFVEGKDNLPSIKLYKPAPNLAQIGWTTRVPFEKAVKQSIAAAKIFLLESQTNTKKVGNKTFVDKLRSFVDLADSSSTQNTDNLGPVSRLIAERRKQEELKKQRVEYAVSTYKEKRKRRPRTFGERFQNTLWNQTLSLGKSFSFFRNRTPTELGFMLFSFLLLVVFYFNIFSPAVVLMREVLIVIPEYESLQNNIIEGDIKEIQSNATTISNSIDNMNIVIGKFEWAASIFNLSRNYNELTKSLQVLKIYSDGVKDVGYAMEPFYSYVSEFKNNTQVRAGTDSYLTVSNTGQDYSPYLTELHTREPYISLGVDKIIKGTEEMNKIDLSLLPGFLQTRFVNFRNTFASNKDWAEKVKGSANISDILGLTENRSYLILLHDNTRLKPVGGEIASFALITLTKGGISDIIVQSPIDVSFDFSTVSPKTLEQINLRKFTYKNNQTLNINDFGSIRDYETFSREIKTVFGKQYNRTIDGVVSLNYSALENLIRTVSKDQKFDVNSVNFNEGSFLTNLINAQDSTESLASKYRISSRILSSLLNTAATNVNQDLPEYITAFDKEISNNNLLISAETLGYSEFIDIRDLDSSLINETNSYFTVGLSIDDQKVVNTNRYPDITTDSKIKINKDLSESIELNLSFPEARTTQEVSVCMPAKVPNSTISYSSIPVERVAINVSGSEKCVVFKVLSESQLKLSWSISDPTTTSGGLLSTALGIGKVRGTSTTAYYSFNLDDSLTFNAITPSLEITDNQTTFTEVLTADKIWELTFKK